MTRDEAIEIIHSVTYRDDVGVDADLGRKWSGKIVDGFIALGVLKVDKPKSATARLAEGLGWVAGGRSEGELIEALAKANLKLVEK